MRNSLSLFTLIVVLLFALPVSAAFPVNAEAALEMKADAKVKSNIAHSLPASLPGKSHGNTGTAEAFAIVSFVTGLLFLPLVPVVFGALSLSNPDADYRGLAIAGLVLGAVATALWVLAILSLAALL